MCMAGWLAGWLWAFGEERGGGCRAGQDSSVGWAGPDKLGRVDGWVSEWMDGRGLRWRGRQFLGRWAAERVGCKGGGATEVQEGPSRASIDEVSREKEKKEAAELII